MSDSRDQGKTGVDAGVASSSGFAISTLDGMYIRQEVLPARTMMPQHSHLFDHSSLLARGRVVLWRDGEPEGIYAAPAILVIKAGIKHAFQTLGDSALIYCLHNLHGKEWVQVLEEHDLAEEGLVAPLVPPLVPAGDRTAYD